MVISDDRIVHDFSRCFWQRVHVCINRFRLKEVYVVGLIHDVVSSLLMSSLVLYRHRMNHSVIALIVFPVYYIENYSKTKT